MAVQHIKNLTMGQTTDTTMVGPNDWNSAHSQLYTLVGNTTGASTVGGTDVQFSGGNNVTLNGNGSVLGISVGGGRAGYLQVNDGSHTTLALAANTLWVFPINNNDGLIIDRCLHPISVSTTSSTSGSVSGTLQVRAGLYSNNNSTLSLITSGSQTYTFNCTSNLSQTLYNGFRKVSIPLAATIDGPCWLAFGVSISSSSVGNALLTFANVMVTNSAMTYVGDFGVASNVSMQFVMGSGTYSVTTNAIPGSIAFSQIRQAGGALNTTPVLWLQNGTA